MNSRVSQSAFTLVEITVVIAILAILATMILLTFGQATRKAALDSSYASVITALESARGKAMQGVGDGSEKQVVTILNDEIVNANNTTIQLSPTVSTDQANKVIEFDRISGMANVGSPLVITLTDGNGNTRTATVTPEGYIYHE